MDVLITDEIAKPIVRKGWNKCLEFDYIANQNLADNFQDETFKIDCLIGCDSAYQFLDNHSIKGEGPVLQPSNLGCFVSGTLRQIGLNSHNSWTKRGPYY